MDYPYAGEPRVIAEQQAQHKAAPPREVIVFIVGGVTYEEAKTVAELNRRADFPVACILGGSSVQTSTTFLAHLREQAR